MIVLGIETSCDETSVAIVAEGRTVLANVVASQAELHARYGGVVPEVASRKHVERMLPTLTEALEQAGIGLDNLGAIAVTNRPGLLGALLVGVSAAKALAYLLKLPLVPVNHLEGHIYSAFLAAPDLIDSFPMLVLIVSGGHTQIVRMDGHGLYTLLGRTRDDAAGEAFDKGARLLGLSYPGGPNLARLAEQGDPKAVSFPRSMMGEGLEFSFSGLKTALRSYLVRREAQESSHERVPFVENKSGVASLPDIAASYQAAIVDVLVAKVRRAAAQTGIRSIGVVGGVSANRSLGESLERLAAQEGLRIVVPESILCTDNAAMVAAAGFYRLNAGAAGIATGAHRSLGFDTFATETLGHPIAAP